jgi:hypothetical protein
VELIFGPKSNIGRLLQEKLEIDIEELLKQLGIFSLAAAYILSKMQIFSKHSFVNVKGLADETTYQKFWNLCHPLVHVTHVKSDRLLRGRMVTEGASRTSLYNNTFYNNILYYFFFSDHHFYESLVKGQGTSMCLEIFHEGFDLHWSNLVSVSACC